MLEDELEAASSEKTEKNECNNKDENATTLENKVLTTGTSVAAIETATSQPPTTTLLLPPPPLPSTTIDAELNLSLSTVAGAGAGLLAAVETNAALKLDEKETTVALAPVKNATAAIALTPTELTTNSSKSLTSTMGPTGGAVGITEILDDSVVVCEKDMESDIADEDNDDETKENYEGFNGTGRNVTLQTLMAANVLLPGKSVMTIEYLGQKFVGDLLADGKIKSHETETIFLTPSAWAMHCKRIINPEKKSGCGWASVKYKGKKLDAYKTSWLRKCALLKESTPDDCEADLEKKSDSPLPVVKRTLYQHNTIANRGVMHDANMLIESVPFDTLCKLQPFLLTISSSCLLLADFHCHLTMREVCGYLGGSWDINTHTLAITKTYPCRNSRFDRHKAAEVEREIQKAMARDKLLLVGWYHSHPKFQAEPTLRDCDAQLDYQIRMRGISEMTYTPCVSIIISPYYDENPTLESVVKSIWIVPPNETKHTLEYGRPMLMQYSIQHDKEIPEDVRTEIQSCVDYYGQYRNEMVKFRNVYNDDTTYIEKLKNTLYPKFPLKQSDKALWNWICAVLDCEQEDDFIPPKTIKIIDNDDQTPTKLQTTTTTVTTAMSATTTPTLTTISAASITNNLKLNDLKDDALIKAISAAEEAMRKTEEELAAQTNEQQKASELKVMSLQEQLCMPSGLNMNPVRMLSPLATPNPTAATAAAATPILPSIVPPILNQNNNTNNSNANGTSTSLTSALLPPAALPPVITQQSLLSQPAAPPPPPVTTISTTTSASSLPSASPRDSPITIPSNSASPAKFEVPVRASPSPAKSDTSSHTSRTRNSPAPSPGKFSISDIARNSPSITPNKYDTSAAALVPPSAACLPTANDLMAASLAQLAGQLPPNFLQADIAALFQQHQQQQNRKDYGNSSLNQLAAAAAKVGGQKQSAAQQAAAAAAHAAVPMLGDLTDPNMAAAVAAYSNSFNMPLPTSNNNTNNVGGGGGGGSAGGSNSNKSKSERSSKSSSSSSSSSTSSSSSNSYKTKLMKELDELKNDPLKMSELIRSPEYAALLLQQAEALGATTLGTLGFGPDFSYLTGTGLGMPGAGNVATQNSSNNSTSSNKSSKSSITSQQQQQQQQAAAAAAALSADYNNLIQASKLLGYDSYMQQQSKQNNDLNAYLQQQMAAAAAAANIPQPPTTTSSSKKQQQQQQQQQTAADYTALLQTYSKLFDPNNQFAAAMSGAGKHSANAHNELSALLAAGIGGGVGGMSGVSGSGSSSSSSSKKKQQQQQQQQQQHQNDMQTDMLNQLLQLEKQDSEIKALLYRQNKAAADFNALFAPPTSAAVAATTSSGASNSKSSNATVNSNAQAALTHPAAYYNALAQEKMQDYAAYFQQQHGKYGIPDPLSKSTLAANNLFMPPSALFKIQQESLNAMMMKPPKSTTPSSARTRESSASPALERLTPTKSASNNAAGNLNSGGKYNFSAVDLAISSVPSNTPSPALSDGSNSSASHRRPSVTPPVDLSRLYGELAPPPTLLTGGMPKKRMEFSSIADLAAPPPAKIPKTSGGGGDDVLNLSHD